MEVKAIKSEYINREGFERILGHMQASNALALEVSVATGLRIGDVLKIRTDDIDGNVLHYTAEKTGKSGTKKLPKKLINRLLFNSYGCLCFPGRNPKKHLTRQAVYSDMRKAVEKMCITEHVSPHSARKIYAADLYRETNVDTVRQELQHDNISTTLLYCFSDRQLNGCLTKSDLEHIRQIVKALLLEFLGEPTKNNKKSE